MADRLFGMFGCYISMPLFAMGNGFVEMLDPFIHMRILRGRPGMLECFLSMLHQDIGMPLFAMRHGFLGMFQGFSRMLVSGKGEPAEQRETNKRGNRCHNQCSATDFHFHGSSSVVKVHSMGERHPRYPLPLHLTQPFFHCQEGRTWGSTFKMCCNPLASFSTGQAKSLLHSHQDPG